MIHIFFSRNIKEQKIDRFYVFFQFSSRKFFLNFHCQCYHFTNPKVRSKCRRKKAEKKYKENRIIGNLEKNRKNYKSDF